MRQPLLLLLISLGAIFMCDLPGGAQVTADPKVLGEIYKIKAIDNHAHPLQVVGVGETDMEETYVSTLEPLDIPVRLRADNPEYIQAWRALYGYGYSDMMENHVRGLMETKQRVLRETVAPYILSSNGIH